MIWLIPVLLVLVSFMHIIEDGKLVKEGRFQKSLHKLYAILEPTILRVLDWMMRSKIIGGNRVGRVFLKGVAMALWFLPHGVVTNYDGLERLLTWLEEHGDTHIAIGPCVCKAALGVKTEPYNTDMTILYGAEIYKEILPHEYRYISKDEALKLLKEFEKHGLVHTVFACFNSGRWTFVICNCDPKVCVPMRAYFMVKEGIYPGPLIASVDENLCRGVEECGECLKVCPFNAVIEKDGKSYVTNKCMGCGLCIERCPSGARKLVPRSDYKPRILPLDIMYPKEK